MAVALLHQSTDELTLASAWTLYPFPRTCLCALHIRFIVTASEFDWGVLPSRHTGPDLQAPCLCCRYEQLDLKQQKTHAAAKAALGELQDI